MTKEVLVTIEGIQLGDENSSVTTKAKGIYQFRDGKHSVQYEEHDEEDNINQCFIEFTSKFVDLTKKGVNSTRMFFNLEASSQTEYDTPYGSLLFEIHTKDLSLEEFEEFILVKLHYSLGIDGSEVSDNRIHMRIKSIE